MITGTLGPFGYRIRLLVEGGAMRTTFHDVVARFGALTPSRAACSADRELELEHLWRSSRLPSAWMSGLLGWRKA